MAGAGRLIFGTTRRIAALPFGLVEEKRYHADVLSLAAIVGCGLVVSGCATTEGYASRCERDYAQNRQYSTASGAALGALAGAAIAGEGDRERGAAIGALAGGLLGNQLSERDDPCGYGFGGYNRDGRYGYDRVPRRGSYGYY